MCVKLLIFSYLSFLTFVLIAHKNPLTEKVLLSTHTHVLVEEKECFGDAFQLIISWWYP